MKIKFENNNIKHNYMKKGLLKKLLVMFLLTLCCNMATLMAQHQIGDVISNANDGTVGVVFWVAPDGSGGWMVAINDEPSTVRWSANGRPSVVTEIAAPATDTWDNWNAITIDEDGYANTQALRNAGSATDYPAAYAVDFDHGWYLPTAGQLSKLYAVQGIISTALANNGGSELNSTGNYWSSTPVDASNAWTLASNSGRYVAQGKVTSKRVRAVRNFISETIIYDTTLNYSWNTGETTPTITVAPETTTQYTVTAESSMGCRATASQQIYVASTDPQYLWDTICAGDAYNANGYQIPAVDNVNPGDSLIMRYMSAGTCTANIYLNLHKKYLPAPSSVDVTLCPHGHYIHNGIEYSSTGQYTQVLQGVNGCDSIVTINVTILPDIPVTYIYDTICRTEPYTTAGYTDHGANISPVLINSVSSYNQTITLESANHCDSIIVLNLYINPILNAMVLDTICSGAGYHEYNFDIDASETVDTSYLIRVQHTTSSVGCDSITSLLLTIFEHTDTVAIDTIVENQLNYTWNDSIFTGPDTIVTIIPNRNGCDSTITMILEVLYNVTDTVRDTICASDLSPAWTWNDSLFYGTDTITTILPTERGVDSILTMILVVNDTNHVTVNDTIGEDLLPYTWTYGNNNEFSHVFPSDGPFIDTLPNMYGCDSILTLNLIVLPNTHDTLRDTICADGFPYTFGPFTFDTVGEQIDTATEQYGVLTITHYFMYEYELPISEGISGFTNPICPTAPDQTIIAAVSHGTPDYTYTWTSDNLVSNTDNNAVIQIAGSNCGDTLPVYLLITDANGCLAHDTAKLIVNDEVKPIFSGTVPTQNALVSNCVFTVPDVTELVRAVSSDNCTATEDLQITQSPVSGTELQNGLTAGAAVGDENVAVAVVDQCGNADTMIVVVHYEATLSLNTGVRDARCFGTATGTIFDTINGNSDTYTIEYRDEEDNIIHTSNVSGTSPVIDSLNNLYAGNYSMTVTDTNGCSISGNVTIDELEDIQPGTISSDQTICENDVLAELTGTEATGGVAPAYEWQMSTDGTTFNPAVAPNDQQNYQPTETQPGDYYYRRAMIDDCGTLYSDTIHIIINPIYTIDITDATCESAGYNDRGLVLTAEQTTDVTAVDTTLALHTIGGNCDSIVNFHIDILQHSDTTITQTIIQNQLEYDWVIAGGTFHYTEAGEQYTTIPNAAGCDSNITLVLIVLENVSNVADSTVCDDELPLVWNNITFNGAGSESVTLTSANGTDSTLLMNVYVNPTYNITIRDTVNERQLPHEFSGTPFNTDVQDLVYSLESQLGCDSVVHYNLTIIRDTAEYDTTSICAIDLPYNWHNHDFEEAGTITDTVIGTYGDYHLYFYTLYVNDMPVIDAIAGFTNPICPTAPDQDIFATVSGGSGNYNYTWTSQNLVADNAHEATIQIAGSDCGDSIWVYLTVTDDNNCSANDSTVLVVNDTVRPTITGTIPVQSPIVNNCVYTVPDVTSLVRAISADNCTAREDLTVAQSPEAGAELLNGLTGTAQVNDEPITVTVTDQCGNVQTTTVIVHYELTLTISSGVRDAYCYGSATGAIFDTIDGNNIPFIITYTDGNGNVLAVHNSQGTAPIVDSLNNVPAGTYTITVDDNDGCSITSIVTIDQLPALNPGTIADDQVICEGNTIGQLTGDEATGGANPVYQWQTSRDGVNFNPSMYPNDQQDYQPTETLPGTYYYRRAWIDDCGTVYSDTITVVINRAQEEHVFAQICVGQAYDANGFNITETDEAGTFEYTNTLTTSLGCDSVVTLQLTILEHSDTTISRTIVENQLPYTWNEAGSSFIFRQAETQTTVIPNAAGCDSTINMVLNVLENVSAEVDSTICDNRLPIVWNNVTFTTAGDQNATLTASNGTDSTVLMHLYVNPTSNVVINETVNERQLPREFNGVEFNNDVSNYTVLLSNQYDCDSTVTYSLVVIRDTADYDTTAICADAYPYYWHGHNFTRDTTIIDTVVGQYGEYFLHYYTMNTNPVPSITDITGFTNPICPTAPDQVLTATIEDGTVPYSYVWNSTHITSTQDNTANVQIAGSYCGENIPVNLTVNDANGCSNSYSVTLVVNDTVAPVFSDTIPTQDALVNNCVFSVPDVTALVRAVSSDNCTNTSDLQIVQNPSANTIIYNNTSVAVNVTDGCNNTSTIYVNVTFIQDFSIDVTPRDVRCYGDNNGAARVDVNGTATPYTYQWYDNNGNVISTIDSISNLYEGTYTISVTDANGCNIRQNAVIGHLFDPMDAGNISDDQSICYEHPINQLVGTVATGGNASYYQWQVSTDGTNFTPAAEPNNTQNYQPEGLATEDLYFRRAWISDECGTLYSNTIHIAVHPLYFDTLYDNVCEGTVYNNNGFFIQGYETSGVESLERSRVEYSQFGCDSLITIELTIIHHTTSQISDTIVENDLPHTFNGQTFNNDVTDTHIVIPNSVGCDSNIYYTLVVLRNTYETVDTSICRSELPLRWHGLTFNDAGEQQLTVQNPNGTDNIITYRLFINELPNIISLYGYSNPICPSVQYQFINSSVTGGYAPYTYEWSGDNLMSTTGDNTIVQIEGTACGTNLNIILNVTDNNGCKTADTAVLIINDTIPPVISDTIYPQPASVSNCVFSVPTLTELVRNISSDNCTATPDLQITQSPAAGTTINDNTMVTVNVTDFCGNTSTTHIYVTIPDTISITGTVVDARCFGESNGSVQVTVGGGTPQYSYTWIDINTGDVISSTTEITNQPEGDYEFTVTDVNNCTNSRNYHINTLFDEMFAGTIASDQAICYGEPIAGLTGTQASGGNSSYYQWQMSTDGTTFVPADGTNNQQNYTVNENATRTLYFRRAWISDECGTLYSDTVTIIANPIYSDTIIDDICQDHEYNDNDFVIDAGRTHVPSTIVEVQNLTTAAGCDSIRTLILTINPSTYDTLYTTVCQGESFSGWNFNVAAQEIADPGTYEFTQNLSAITGCDSVVTLYITVYPTYEVTYHEKICEGISYNNHGFYVSVNETIGTTQLVRTQFLTTPHGCDSIITLTLDVIDTAVAIVSLAEDFCDNYSTVLTVESNMESFIWSTGELGNEIEVTSPGRYIVTASQEGCSAQAAINIPDCEFVLYLPNCITTTNDDGLNDYFYIPEYNQRFINEFEIYIYNRWGQLIYHSEDKHFEWHGDYHGKVFHNMVYTYVINCTNHAGRKYQYKGTITVL